MNNLSGLFKAIDQQKALVTPSKKWPWKGRTKFQPGKYRVRFMSHEEKCPDGFRIYTVHELQKEPCDRWSLSMDEMDAAYHKIMCTESYKGFVPSEDGTTKLAVPCPVCDVHSDILTTYKGEDVDEDLLKAVDEMSSNACRRFLYPILVYATETEVTNDKGKKNLVLVPDDRNCVGVVLNLLAKNYDGNADLALIRLLHEHVFCEEDHLSPRRGRWFTWDKKSNGQTIAPSDKQALIEKELDIYSKMSNIHQFGMGVGEGKFVKNYKAGYPKGIAMINNTWFIKALIQHHGYSLDNLGQGLV